MFLGDRVSQGRISSTTEQSRHTQLDNNRLGIVLSRLRQEGVRVISDMQAAVLI